MTSRRGAGPDAVRGRRHTTQPGFRGVARTAGKVCGATDALLRGRTTFPVSNKIDARLGDEVDSIVRRRLLLRREEVVVVAHERRRLQEYEARALAAAPALRKLHSALD